MNCVLGSPIWSVLLYLSNYCIRNVKPQTCSQIIYLPWWPYVSYVWSPAGFLHLCSEHIHSEPCLLSFHGSGTHLWWPSLNTGLGVRDTVGHFGWCGSTEWGVCVIFNDGPSLGMTTLWCWSWWLPWEQLLSLSLLIAPYSSALLPGKDQF